MNYLGRILSKDIQSWLFKGKVIVITGARQVGKTTLLKSLFSGEDILWLNADEAGVRNRLNDSSVNDLKGVVGNYKLVVIDEIQRLESAGLVLKLLADHFEGVQIVATGSSALEISDKIFEPLTGRQILFHLYPFSLAELYPKKSTFEIEQNLPFHLVYGNYPDICNNRADAETLLKNLSGQYLYKDVLIWKDIRKPELLDKLLKLLAYQCGAEVSVNELSNQLKVKSETVESYIDLLEKSFVVHRLSAYSSNSRKEVSKMSKIYFWDNGIRNALLDDFRPLEIRPDVGQLWENFIVGERMKMNTWLKRGAKSYFWRNIHQREVDYVEHVHQKLYAYEMKWNTEKNHKVTAAFTNLYPEAKVEVITPVNFNEFCFL